MLPRNTDSRPVTLHPPSLRTDRTEYLWKEYREGRGGKVTLRTATVRLLPARWTQKPLGQPLLTGLGET